MASKVTTRKVAGRLVEAHTALEKEKDRQAGTTGQILSTMGKEKVEKEKVVERKVEKEKVKARKEKERKEKAKEKEEKVKEHLETCMITKVIGSAITKTPTPTITASTTTGTDGMKKSGMTENLKLNNILLLCFLSHLKKAHSIVFSSSLQKDGSQGRREREFLLNLVCRTSAAGPRRHGSQLALAAGTCR